MDVQSYAPVLQVADLPRALAFYVGALGCAETFRVGDYAGLSLGRLRLHLSANTSERPVGGGSVYVFCDEIDAFCERLGGAGVVIARGPLNTDYGMREMLVEDPDGNFLTFGVGTEDH